MSAARSAPPAPVPRSAHRGLRYAVAVPFMLVSLALLAYQLFFPVEDEDGVSRFRRVVSPTKKRVAPSAGLGIEYHFDRNAVVDSRLAGRSTGPQHRHFEPRLD